MVYGALSPSFGSKKQGDFLLVFHLNSLVHPLSEALPRGATDNTEKNGWCVP
jgi:hypothetical protein